ncbi:MAG TPA: hypothetical protein VFF52_29525 [Isosphaeraceae bacterium]|nr:hypothetical protein [Isosphaeraceae bacterium]
MAHTLTIDVPETVYHSLERWAAHHGTTPEALARDWVARRVIELENDPLLRWAGAIDSDVADVAERHDRYLGQALRQEVRDDPRGSVGSLTPRDGPLGSGSESPFMPWRSPWSPRPAVMDAASSRRIMSSTNSLPC